MRGRLEGDGCILARHPLIVSIPRAMCGVVRVAVAVGVVAWAVLLIVPPWLGAGGGGPIDSRENCECTIKDSLNAAAAVP